ncbi:MAG: DUF4388 domain-containing protein [Myxococcales bacterium]|nr:DUF4388 domain-containing protein [Myxococcales bacterium]
MAVPSDGILTVVIGDDAVAAGMLALDLVQAGFDAHGAADVWAAAEQLRQADQEGPAPVLVAIHSDLSQTLRVWHHMRDHGVHTQLIGVVASAQADEAHVAAGGQWLGVLRAPLHTPTLIELLTRHGQGGDQDHDVESGRLDRLGVIRLLERELLAARRDPARRNSIVRLEAGERIGELAIVDGELVHAHIDTDRGRHALERMACWKTGSWQIIRQIYTDEHTLSGGWRGVMAVGIEYARRVDEARRTMLLTDHVCVVRWERVRPLPVVAEALFRRIASGITLGEALSGPGDDELEAYAALATRIRRGAIEPLEQTLVESESRHPTSDHPRPGVSTSGGQIMAGVRPSRGLSIRSSESHRRPNRRPPSSEVGRVSAPESTPDVEGRHDATSSYKAVPLGPFVGRVPTDLPEIPVGSVREYTPTHTPILPANLPDAESDSWDAAPAHDGRDERPVYASTGWFGLNVGQAPDAELGARVDAMRDALVQAGTRQASSMLQARMSQSVAELPRVVTEEDGFDDDETADHYSLFASEDELDAADEEVRSQLTQLAPSGIAGRRARLFWIAALCLVASALALVILPNSPIYDDQSGQPAALRSYAEAVELIDTGKSADAAALLRLVYNRPSVPPEATLQLAVLEVKERRFSDAKTHLRAYIREPNAKHVVAAKRLWAHVFGPIP